MKFLFFSVLVACLFAVFAQAITIPRKAVIVSYPSDTPNSVLDEAKAAVKAAGGMVTHEYKLIKAFAAKASEATLTSVKAMGERYNAIIEEDTTFTIAGSGAGSLH